MVNAWLVYPWLNMLQDPEEYYRPAGGLLTFDMHLGNLIEQSVPYHQDPEQSDTQRDSEELMDSLLGHFNLINAQLQQVN